MKAFALAPLLLLIACAGRPRPVVFQRVDRARAEGIAARDGSPALWAKAEGLRRRAELAYRAGDTAAAELLGEHAVATYRHVIATARAVSATIELDRDAARLAAAEERLAEDSRALEETERDVARLEAELLVRREALVPVAPGKADPAREAARWSAARANLAVADATCTGAGLLAPSVAGLEAARALVAELEARARDGKGIAPIDASTRARALCLAALTKARAVAVAGGGASGDLLASELRTLGFEPGRDERGVVVVLPQSAAAKDLTFAAGTADLTARGKARVDELGALAKRTPGFALVVIARGSARDAGRIKTLIDTLLAAGVDPARVAGGKSPLDEGATAGKGDGRLEIVFVGGTP